MPETKWLGLRKPLGTLKATAVDDGTDSTMIISPEDAEGIDVGDKLKLYSVNDFQHTRLGDRVTVTAINELEGAAEIVFDPPVGEATATGNEAFALEVVDVETWVSEQMDVLDTVPGALMLDAHTEWSPDRLKAGVFGFDTETEELLYWNHNEEAWRVWQAPYMTPGYVWVDWSLDAGNTVGLNQSDLYFTISLRARPNRVYLIEYSVDVELVSGTSAEGFMVVRVADGDTVTENDELLARLPLDLPPVGTGNCLPYAGQCHLFTVNGGALTIGFYLDRKGMSGAASSMRIAGNTYNMFTIDELGEWVV